MGKQDWSKLGLSEELQRIPTAKQKIEKMLESYLKINKLDGNKCDDSDGENDSNLPNIKKEKVKQEVKKEKVKEAVQKGKAKQEVKEENMSSKATTPVANKSVASSKNADSE